MFIQGASSAAGGTSGRRQSVIAREIAIITVLVVSVAFIRGGRGRAKMARRGGVGISSRRVHRRCCARKQIKNVRRALINSRVRRGAELTRPNERRKNEQNYIRAAAPLPPRPPGGRRKLLFFQWALSRPTREGCSQLQHTRYYNLRLPVYRAVSRYFTWAFRAQPSAPAKSELYTFT